MKKWTELYYDTPSHLLKVSARNPGLIQTSDAERKCASPAGLQSRIDDIVASFNKKQSSAATLGCRSFVRPSGTEPVVRIYAEAPTLLEADALAAAVKEAVLAFCN